MMLKLKLWLHNIDTWWESSSFLEATQSIDTIYDARYDYEKEDGVSSVQFSRSVMAESAAP